MDGYEFLRRVRGDGELFSLQVIVPSAVGQREKRDQLSMQQRLNLAKQDQSELMSHLSKEIFSNEITCVVWAVPPATRGNRLHSGYFLLQKSPNIILCPGTVSRSKAR